MLNQPISSLLNTLKVYDSFHSKNTFGNAVQTVFLKNLIFFY